MELVTGTADLLHRLAATVAEIEAVGREFLARNHGIADQAHQGDIIGTLIARDVSLLAVAPADRRRVTALALSRIRGDDPQLFAGDFGVGYTARLTARVTGQTDHLSLRANARSAGEDGRRRANYALVRRLLREGKEVPTPPAEREPDDGR